MIRLFLLFAFLAFPIRAMEECQVSLIEPVRRRLADYGFPLENGEKIGDHFTVVAANASLEKARVLIIGDQHPHGVVLIEDVWRAEYANVLINRVAKDGDWLLMEGLGYDPTRASLKSPCPLLTASIRAKLNFSGWEDMKLHQKALNLLNGEKRLYHEYVNLPDFDPSRPLTQTEKGQQLLALHVEALDALINLRNRAMFAHLSRLAAQPGNHRLFLQCGTPHVYERKLIDQLLESDIPFVILADPSTL